MENNFPFENTLLQLYERWIFVCRSSANSKVALLLFMAAIAFPALAAQSVTGGQLEQILVAAHGKPDAKVAKQLLGLELTERLSATGFSSFGQGLSGPKARQALVALADMSAFLDLPATEIPLTANPDLETQRKMISLMVNYIETTIHQLPNFFATRPTTSFQVNLSSADRALHLDGTRSGIILYRDGEEELNSTESNSKVPGLTTSGEFGPILGTALLGAAQGNLTWSHWEQGATGPEAVYRYAVTAEKSHYQVQNQFSGYRGEITIDQSDGVVLRLILRADPPPLDPFRVADIVVEYGAVELGQDIHLSPEGRRSMAGTRIGLVE
jgi:hypothetical protein